MDLVDNVDGCDVIIVDDMIDTAGTLCKAGVELRRRGARRMLAFATHGWYCTGLLSALCVTNVLGTRWDVQVYLVVKFNVSLDHARRVTIWMDPLYRRSLPFLV